MDLKSLLKLWRRVRESKCFHDQQADGNDPRVVLYQIYVRLSQVIIDEIIRIVILLMIGYIFFYKHTDFGGRGKIYSLTLADPGGCQTSPPI